MRQTSKRVDSPTSDENEEDHPQNETYDALCGNECWDEPESCGELSAPQICSIDNERLEREKCFVEMVWSDTEERIILDHARRHIQCHLPWQRQFTIRHLEFLTR